MRRLEVAMGHLAIVLSFTMFASVTSGFASAGRSGIGQEPAKTAQIVFYVSGHVRNPGRYPLLTDQTTVREAIARARGLTPRGDETSILIVRVVRGERKEIKVNWDDPVLPNDTVVVKARPQ
jgi:SLBB domain